MAGNHPTDSADNTSSTVKSSRSRSSSSDSNSDSDSDSNSNKSSNPVIISDKLEKRYVAPYQPTVKTNSEDTPNELKQDVESNNNFDEIIASTEAASAKSLKKYLLKENKKYRKKYVSNDDYRQAGALNREPREAPVNEDDAEAPTTSAHKVSNESEKPHSRMKRLIWVTDDGRLALPPGTSLTIAPTIALPFVRYPPTGFLSNISISLPVTSEYLLPQVFFA